MVRQIVRRVFLGLATASLFAVQGMAQGVNGLYRVEGRNPDGSAYSGSAQLVEINDTVTIAWQVAGQGYQGTGTRNGDIVWVNWGADHPVVYVVMPSGQLHGTWANGQALERLVP